MRRGQSAVEFVLLVSFMLLVFFGFFVIIQGRIIELSHKQDLLFLKEANNIVVSEVDLALAAAPDFQHSFTVPDKASTIFEMNITDGREVYSRYGFDEYVNFFPFNITGHLNAVGQENMIYHTDGRVIFPNASEVFNSTYAGISINVNPEECYLATVFDGCVALSIAGDMVPLCQLYFILC